VEIAPLAMNCCAMVARALRVTRGAALFVDYGEDRTTNDSLRGFRRHTQVNALSEPGLVDLTTDVDFSVCRAVLEAEDIQCTLRTQRAFLLEMGALERVAQLIENQNTTEAQASELVAAYERLVGDEEMGTRYKALMCAYPSIDIASPQVPDCDGS
jgi:NADH dehydrogenase [ubiquinone] 1 alpha subcomplex assembly factor 7